MQTLTPAGQNLVNDVASRYNISTDAVIHMLVAVNNGGGSMAQFNSPELGGFLCDWSIYCVNRMVWRFGVCRKETRPVV